MTEDGMVESHHQLSGHEFEQGDSEGQRSLVWCSPWSHKELNMTEQLDNNEGYMRYFINMIYTLNHKILFVFM